MNFPEFSRIFPKVVGKLLMIPPILGWCMLMWCAVRQCHSHVMWPGCKILNFKDSRCSCADDILANIMETLIAILADFCCLNFGHLFFHAVNGVSDCGPWRESCKTHARQGSKRQSTQILIGHWSRTADPCGSCPVHGGCHGISHVRIRRCNQMDSCLASNSSRQIVEVSQFSGWEPSGDFRFFSSANPCCFHF